MLALTLAALVAAVVHGHKRRSYVVMSWAVPLLWTAVFYTVLVFDIEPINSDLDLRLAFFRPGQAFLFAGIVVYLLNGRVNAALDHLFDHLERAARTVRIRARWQARSIRVRLEAAWKHISKQP